MSTFLILCKSELLSNLVCLLLAHTTAFRQRISADYLRKTKDLKAALEPQLADMKATRALVQYFDAQARSNGLAVSGSKTILNEIFEKKNFLTSNLWNKGRRMPSNESSVFDMLVFLLESIAYELNIEKPSSDKVDQLY